jgi:hypothetical protein
LGKRCTESEAPSVSINYHHKFSAKTINSSDLGSDNMKRLKIILLVLLVLIVTVSCRKEEVSNRDNLIKGTWDCIDYSDSVTNELKGHPPVFISNLYEIGYAIKRNGLMWIRNMGNDNKLFTDKGVECGWVLSKDNLELKLVFPDNAEAYEIVELTRKKMILRGKEGFWAGNESTYIFEKK